MREDVMIDIDQSSQFAKDIIAIGDQLELMWGDYVSAIIDIYTFVIKDGDSHDALGSYIDNLKAMNDMFKSLSSEIQNKNNEFNTRMDEVDSEQIFNAWE